MSPRAPALALGLLAAVLATPSARATGFAHRGTDRSCLECHVDRQGRRGLNEHGRRTQQQGLRLGRDPALTVTREGAPLSRGGERLLVRRYRRLGQRLFHLREVGSVGQSCADCHGAERPLVGVAATYPKPRQDLGRWATLGDAIDACLEQRMGTTPLRRESRTAVAMQLYLRDLEPTMHPTRAVARPVGG